MSEQSIKHKKSIVILCNLGGPNDLDEVEEFLLGLLGDPHVIQLPALLKPFQRMLARLIVRKRLPFSQKLYIEIGGSSPINKITSLQAQALSQNISLPVFPLMRHSRPREAELLAQIRDLDFDKVVILPLYPQYSTTTTESSFAQVKKFFAEHFPDRQLEMHFINDFPEQELFIEAWLQRIKNRLKHCNPEVRLIFSAHGIPQKYVDKGDPYLKQLKMTFNALMRELLDYKGTLTFQSKFGPGKWLEPSTEEFVCNLPEGSEVLIVPISFVSDHVETIHEIGIELKKEAARYNIKVHRVPGLNTSAKFIESLATLVREHL